MPLEKITSQQMDAKGVCAAPDILNGTTTENKAIFDRMVRELIAPAYNACVDLVNTLDTEEDQREEAEALRKSAEKLRISAETARQNAESGRLTAEQSRAEAEQLRAAAEQLRYEAEELRASAEQTRITNETARSTAESGRTVEEAKRVTAEKNRLTAEQARAAAETQRDAAETDRQSKSSAMQVWEEYDSARAYVPLNKVVWNGSSYICIQGCTGVLPENGNYWLMIARKGVDGATVSTSGQYGFAVEDGHLILYYTGDTPPDFSIDESGHLILHFDDTHTMDIGAVIGPPGPAGPGVPAGGTAGQVLTKSSDEDYKTEWKDASASGGLSSDEKAKILSLFKNTAYTADMSTVITQLETLWSGSSGDSGGESGGGESGGGETETTYTVTNNLTNVTNSNSQAEVTEGFYSATLTVVDGYSMNSVVITMGGVDITDSVYGDGGILITEVTGDIVITAVAGVALAYALPEPLTFAGTGNAVYDTGYAMYAGEDCDRSVCVDMVITEQPGGVVGYVSTVGNDAAFRIDQSGAKIMRAWNGRGIANVSKDGRTVINLVKGGKGIYTYRLIDGVVTSESGQSWGYDITTFDRTATIKIGMTDTALKGTVNDFRVYDQILSDGQIEAYLRGSSI